MRTIARLARRDHRRRRRSSVSIAVAVLSVVTGLHDRMLAADGADGLELPADGTVVVLELAYQDAGGGAFEPVVSLHADGSILVRDDGGDLHGNLTPEQLTGLLRDVVTEGAVFELDSGRIQQEVRAAAERTGRPWRVSNAGVMRVRVRLREREHEVNCHSPEIWHERFPDVASLADLCFIRRRLESVRAIVQVGGWESAEGLSELANRELLRTFPEATPVTALDLRMVRGRSSELRYVQFVTPLSTAGGESLMISVFELPNQPAQVRIAPLSGL